MKKFLPVGSILGLTLAAALATSAFLASMSFVSAASLAAASAAALSGASVMMSVMVCVSGRDCAVPGVASSAAGGVASAAFIAYLSSLTNVSYSATQYALFSSMMLLLPKWLAGFSGQFVDAQGYSAFFTGTALLGLPVLLLVALAAGLVVSLFQAATQINEQTLSFIPRLLVMLLTLIWAGPWLVRELMEYTQTLVQNIPLLIG